MTGIMTIEGRLDRLQTAVDQLVADRDAEKPMMLTIEECARMLRCSEWQVRRKIADGTIPATKNLVGHPRIPRIALEARIAEFVDLEHSPGGGDAA